MPRPPLRIAVLECDTPIPSVEAKYGSYGDIFTSLLNKAASGLPTLSPSSLEISTFDVVTAQEYPSLESIDAILLSGSKHDSFESDPWILKLVDYVKDVLAQDRVRLVGVCFGHQIIGRAMGVKVGRSDRGWEVSVTPVELTAKGKEIFGKDDLNIHQMHKDIVYEYPKGVEPLGHNGKCPTQGMYIRKRLITVQGHPEFSETIMRELLEARHGSGVIDDEIYNGGIATMESNHDGIIVAQAFLKFIMED